MPRPLRGLDNDQIERLKTLRREQKTIQECADIFYMGFNQMQRIAAENGVAGYVCPHCGGSVPSRKLGMKYRSR